MYKRLATIFIFAGISISLSTPLVAQDWVPANGVTTTNTINRIQFVTEQVAYGIGDWGTILKSSDGGETWTDISYEDTRNFNGLYFFDENTGLVGGPFSTGGGGSSEMLAETTDGGDTWEVFSSFDFDDFNDMDFLDNQTGWAASINGKILYTLDAGDNWSSKNAGMEDLLSIHLYDNDTFWVAGESGSLYKSTDSGDTWEKAVQIDTLGLSEFDDLYDVEFENENIGYVIGETYDNGFVGFLLKTTDGGTSWERSVYNFEHVLYDIKIGSNGEVVLAGGKDQFTENESNAVFISEDQGDTWRMISDGAGPLYWTSLDENSGNWIVAGESGATSTFALSNDTLYSDLYTGSDIAEITFGDSDHGVFVTGGREQARIFATSDGGDTWEERLKLNGRIGFNSVDFAGDDYVWAVGTNYFTGDSRWVVYYSTDKGLNWNNLELDFPVHEQLEYVQKVQFTDLQNGFIKVEDALLKTTDAGASWEKASEPTPLSFTDFHTIHFLDSNNGWMAGNDHVAYTDDGGATWETKYEQGSQESEIIEIFAVDNTTVYTTIENGRLMKTTDGGTTWEDINPFTSFDLNDLYFINANSGYVVGEGGRILTTTDGGQNFSVDYDATEKDLHNIFYIDENTAWISGELGTLLSTTNGGGITTSINDELEQALPSAISLDQNYPNPFNPSTVIEFSLSRSTQVKLEVFDLMGRKVRTLLSGDLKNAGQHTITFKANDLASGVYIYRLTAGTEVLTRKLTLIK